MENARRRPLATVIVVVFSLFLISYESDVKLERGYDPEAYPLYFDPISDGGFEKSNDVLKMKSSEDTPADSDSDQAIVSVTDFGAKGDGENDDSQAFLEAWEKACSDENDTIVLVPEGNTYLLKPVRFSGPCKADLTVQRSVFTDTFFELLNEQGTIKKIEIYGTLKASDNRSDYEEDSRHWVRFDKVNNLLVEGGGRGTLDGNGEIWWQQSCKVNKTNPCKDAPTALTFYKCKDLQVNGLEIRNGQQIQLSFDKCKNVEASNLTVTAPKSSPNTDGIHVTGTKNIQISSSAIKTGDDCISIVSGSKNVQAQGITCGPGHGISIGSLGKGKSKAYVSGVTVDGAKLTGTDNGVRIKTWQGGSGSASNIRFQNIQMDKVKNPIIIDQNYCDQDEPCKQEKSAVQVKKVLYQNIKGTSASDVAIKFDCSEYHPCEGIVLDDVEIDGGVAVCDNVKVTERGNVTPSCEEKDELR